MLREAIEIVLDNVCAGRLKYLVPSNETAPGKNTEPVSPKGHPTHSHNFAELVQMVEGKAKLKLGYRSLDLTEKTPWLILPGTFHNEECKHVRSSYRLLWMVFSPVGTNLFISVYHPGEEYRIYPERLIGVTENQALLSELTRNPKASALAVDRAHIQSLLIQVLLAALSGTVKPTSTPADRRQRLVGQIRGYIEHHLYDEVSMEDLAQMARCTPNYLNTIFRRQMGQPIHQYILRCRLDAAKNMLAEGDTPVKEISYKLGFHDPLYFSRLFRKRYGISPTKYATAQKSNTPKSI